MKPHFHKVPIQISEAFSIRHDVKRNFGRTWHYHPELELHYIIKGHGIQFIGDKVDNFNEGDMMLLGSNLPHTWHCSEDYYTNSSKNIEAYVLHFLPESLGKPFLNLAESFLIPKLFEKAKTGLIIRGKTKDNIADLLAEIYEAKDLDRIILFLEILKELSQMKDLQNISSSFTLLPMDRNSESRLDAVYNFILENFKKEITLEEVSSIANMTPTSFSRHFRKMTNKTFTEFLNEVRISHVCRALIENRFPTEVICFKYGYKNVSNFYRNFKKILQMTPREYKQKFLQLDHSNQ